jgi:hypothetical protein
MAMAQSTWSQPPPGDAQPHYAPQQLDQLVAPIALYPDRLLAPILMAATYPIEVVEAARWVQNRNNAMLRGDQLDAALQQMSWNPSVKSLVPFPQILQMMSNRLDWTQALGNAFLAQQADVVDSVQRLRREAWTARTLQSSPQETVSMRGQIISIDPTNPDLVYVPYYDPATVFGGWSYPDYPPVRFAPPPNYGVIAGPGIYFGAGFGVVGVLWSWNHWDWDRHEISIDPDQYNRLNNNAIIHGNRPRYTATTWQHDPTHRRGVPYGDPVVQQKFQPPLAGSPDTRRAFRGFDDHGASPTAPMAAARPADNAPHDAGHMQRPAQLAAPAAQAVGRTAMPPPAAVYRPVAPAFSGFGHGPDVRAQAQRGQASRQSMMPAAAPRAAPQQQHAAPQQQQHTAPAGGGEHRGGGNERQRR